MCTIEGILKRLVECRNPYSETAQQLIARQSGTNLSKVSDVAKRFSIVIDAAQDMHREIEICRAERDSAKRPRFIELFTAESKSQPMQQYIFSDETIGKGPNWGIDRHK